MVEIPPGDWHLLPEVPAGQDSVNLTPEAEDLLMRAGYILGPLQRVIFYEPGVKETNWSATGPVRGPDGVERRWVYLHYFKDGQPSINWLDPTFAGMRLVIGDALHSLGRPRHRRPAPGRQRLPRAREERSRARPRGRRVTPSPRPRTRSSPAWSASSADSRSRSSTWPWTTSAPPHAGRADLSYDFVNRPAYHHALATGDTEFLRLTLNIGLESGLQPISLVHALQNHDELTYELVHFDGPHADDLFPFRGEQLTGGAAGPADPARAHREADRRGRPLQRRLHHQRHRLHDGQRDRGVAGLPRRPRSPPGRSRRSRRRTCCWPCSTPGSRVCSPCRAGTSAAHSPSTPPWSRS